MAANKFATMLHRNTNKITLVLTYALLEWILIALLLLNSLFSYLIIKFAEFFGLKPPCLWCTRIDHIIDSAKGNKNMHRDLLCEAHSEEISRLGYCSNHHKLVESHDMCEDCLSSRPELEESLKNSAFFPWMKELGMIRSDREKVGEDGEVSLNCSCCGVSLDCDKYSSYVLLKTSSSEDVLECAQKENLITEVGASDDDDDRHSESGLCDDQEVLVPEKETVENGCISVVVKELEGENEVDVCLEEEEKEILKEENSTSIMKDKSVQVCVEEDAISTQQHLEFFLDYSGNRLVAVELIDSMTEEHKSEDNAKIEDDENKDRELSPDFEVRVEEKEELVVESGRRIEKVGTFIDVDINEEPNYSMLDSMEMEIEEDENSLFFHPKDCHLVSEEFANFRVFRWPSQEANDVQELAEEHLDVHSGISFFLSSRIISLKSQVMIYVK